MPRGSSHVRRFCITPGPAEGGGLVNHARAGRREERGTPRDTGRDPLRARSRLAFHLFGNFSSLIARRSSHFCRIINSSEASTIRESILYGPRKQARSQQDGIGDATFFVSLDLYFSLSLSLSIYIYIYIYIYIIKRRLGLQGCFG